MNIFCGWVTCNLQFICR